MEHEQRHQLLCRFLAGEDVACPGCGYNLRGLSSDRCPECDQRIRLSVVLENPHTGMLISATAGLLTCFGFGAFVLTMVLVTVCIRGRAWPQGQEVEFTLAVPALAALVGGAASFALARQRGRLWFSRLPPSNRKITVLASWCMPAALLLYYLLRAPA